MIIQCMNPLPIDNTTRLNGVATLSNWGVIRAQGEDAAAFLHSQLTQDFEQLDAGQARLAALCSAKGRMLASFIGFKQSPTEILLLCSRDILAATLKRLAMFVMRAKVKLSDASAEFSVYGLAGDALHAMATGNDPAWSKLDIESAHVVSLYPALGQPRALCVTQAGAIPGALANCAVLPEPLWQWSEVRSAVATISQPVVDAFVPQMLNYESVGGVSFKKGCYPGQEVVARSQFRGSLKRRAALLHSAMPVQSGQEVFANLPDGAVPQDTQPCGLVVQAAASPDGGFDAIVSLQTAVITSASHLSVPAAKSGRLSLLPLPYALLDDI